MIVTHSTCLGDAAFQQGLDVVWIDVEMFAEGLDGPGHVVVRVRHGGPGEYQGGQCGVASERVHGLGPAHGEQT